MRSLYYHFCPSKYKDLVLFSGLKVYSSSLLAFVDETWLVTMANENYDKRRDVSATSIVTLPVSHFVSAPSHNIDSRWSRPEIVTPKPLQKALQLNTSYNILFYSIKPSLTKNSKEENKALSSNGHMIGQFTKHFCITAQTPCLAICGIHLACLYYEQIA